MASFPYKAKMLTTIIFLLIAGSFLEGIAIPSQALSPTQTPIPPSVRDAQGIEMVYVPSGNFDMGISREAFLRICSETFKISDETRCKNLSDTIGEETGVFEIHNVEMPSFWLDRYEVTIEQYQQCANSGTSYACRQINLSLEPKLADNHLKPQVGVIWYDAVYFCNTRGARLPTEAEWEYAAKGPEGNIFPWGNDFNDAYISPVDTTYPVGSVPENKSWAGVYDLAGNAAEWVEDRFLPYVPSGNWLKGSTIEISRVIRGGSWANRTIQVTTFDREYAQALQPDNSIGFRCARSSDPSK